MKLKYYLRGLGIGIIVTALLLGATDKGTVKANETDNRIEEQQTTSEETEQTQESVTESQETEVQTVEEATAMEPTGLEEGLTETEPSAPVMLEEDVLLGQAEALQSQMASEPQEEESQESVNQSEEASQPEETQEEESTSVDVESVLTTDDDVPESYLLNVVRGDDSGTVARKLQNAGLIRNASEFDAYLMQHGYDKSISVGIVEIPVGSSWIEIAEKLSGK